ncbi:MAG: glutamate synthase, partial [Oscillospiraceae bacterium]
MKIDATNINYNLLNEQIKNAIDSKIIIENCEGQRNIAKFSKEKEIEIYGTTGNALGSFMESGSIEVFGDVQDVVGENMKDGKIIVHGSAGSSCGYAMKGGAIYIENNAGYRTGMYMKEYKNNESVIIIGNDTGSYL